MVAVEAALAVPFPRGAAAGKDDVAYRARLLANVATVALAVYVEWLVFYEKFIKKVSQHVCLCTRQGSFENFGAFAPGVYVGRNLVYPFGSVAVFFLLSSSLSTSKPGRHTYTSGIITE